MVQHLSLGSTDRLRKRRLWQLIRKGKVTMAGNSKLKIYGTLHCASGKRMLSANRVFFISEKEALANGYRPCGHCMLRKYLEWKKLL